MMTRRELILDCISKQLTVAQTQEILTDAGYDTLYPRRLSDATAMYVLFHPERVEENKRNMEKYFFSTTE